MGRTRRPYGINQLAVGLACAKPGGTPLTSASLGVFRPVDYYSDGGVRDQIGEFVRSLPLGEADTPGTPLSVAAALFSWGDMARATVFRD